MSYKFECSIIDEDTARLNSPTEGAIPVNRSKLTIVFSVVTPTANSYAGSSVTTLITGLPPPTECSSRAAGLYQSNPKIDYAH